MSHTTTTIHAQELFGSSLDALPKFVLAVMCYYLADICSDAGCNNGQALARIREELSALSGNGLIDEAQANKAIKAILKHEASA